MHSAVLAEVSWQAIIIITIIVIVTIIKSLCLVDQMQTGDHL